MCTKKFQHVEFERGNGQRCAAFSAEGLIPFLAVSIHTTMSNRSAAVPEEDGLDGEGYYESVESLFSMFQHDLCRPKHEVAKWRMRDVARIVLQALKVYPVTKTTKPKWKFVPISEEEYHSRRPLEFNSNPFGDATYMATSKKQPGKKASDTPPKPNTQADKSIASSNSAEVQSFASNSISNSQSSGLGMSISQASTYRRTIVTTDQKTADIKSTKQKKATADVILKQKEKTTAVVNSKIPGKTAIDIKLKSPNKNISDSPAQEDVVKEVEKMAGAVRNIMGDSTLSKSGTVFYTTLQHSSKSKYQLHCLEQSYGVKSSFKLFLMTTVKIRRYVFIKCNNNLAEQHYSVSIC